jgi:hypothetical protein
MYKNENLEVDIVGPDGESITTENPLVAYKDEEQNLFRL